jgi:hypothetical protein
MVYLAILGYFLIILVFVLSRRGKIKLNEKLLCGDATFCIYYVFENDFFCKLNIVNKIRNSF